MTFFFSKICFPINPSTITVKRLIIYHKCLIIKIYLTILTTSQVFYYLCLSQLSFTVQYFLILFLKCLNINCLINIILNNNIYRDS